MALGFTITDHLPPTSVSAIWPQQSGIHIKPKILVRKTICFSKLDTMHDIVIGLFIN